MKCKTLNWFIREVKPNQVFVFGSNLSGRHGAGAARQAMKFGAVYGKEEGLMGNSYGIPTVDSRILNSLSVETIKRYVDRFIKFAVSRPDLEFLVTEIGCGLAYLTPQQIAPLFKDALDLENVYLPERFIKELVDEQNNTGN